jgi:hypothetical protein
VDFVALNAIERELDQLIAEGRWSRENYQNLRARAVVALAGQDDRIALSFIDTVAQPAWRPSHSTKVATMERVPGGDGDVIRQLSRGWRPFLALPAGSGVRWRGRPVDTRRVEVELEAHDSSVVADVSPPEFQRFKDDADRTGILRDELFVELAHGWILRSGNASVRGLTMTTGIAGTKVGVTFGADGGAITRRDRLEPAIWVVPLGIEHDLPPFGNLSVGSVQFLHGSLVSSHSGFAGMRLAGAYTYTLVETKGDGKRSHALVVQPSGGPLEMGTLAQDFVALQFVLGQRIERGIAFGLDGSDVVAAAAPWGRAASRSRNVHVVVAPGPMAGRTTVEFFECLSVAVRASKVSRLAAALNMFLESIDAYFDLAFQNLLLALAVLTSARTDLADLPHGSRAKSFLLPHGVALPEELAHRIDFVAGQLYTRGLVLPDTSDDDAVKPLLRVLAELRTVVVALAAIVVEFRGPIAGPLPTDGPPSWWPVTNALPRVSTWTAEGPPEDVTFGLREDQILVLVGRPEHASIIRWLIAAAKLPESQIVVAAASSPEDLSKQANLVFALGDRVIVVADAMRENVPTARDRARKTLELRSASIEIAPAIPCVESWMLADDALVLAQTSDRATAQRATEYLPDELEDARTLAHKVFGPPSNWHTLPEPNVYRAAERSPSLRNLLDVLARRLGTTSDLPERSVARAFSRDAIAGVIRSLLPDDAAAWRTSDGSTYTGAELAREVEQGTEIGRQYAVDLVSMMVNALSRTAKRGRSV